MKKSTKWIIGTVVFIVVVIAGFFIWAQASGGIHVIPSPTTTTILPTTTSVVPTTTPQITIITLPPTTKPLTTTPGQTITPGVPTTTIIQYFGPKTEYDLTALNLGIVPVDALFRGELLFGQEKYKIGWGIKNITSQKSGDLEIHLILDGKEIEVVKVGILEPGQEYPFEVTVDIVPNVQSILVVSVQKGGG